MSDACMNKCSIRKTTKFFTSSFGHFLQYMCDGRGVERSFPVAANAPDGAMGQEGLHTHPAAVAVHETTTVQIRYHQV